MSPQFPEPKVPQQHAAPEPGGWKLLGLCLYEAAQSWVTGPGCPEAVRRAAGPTSSLNIWPDVASLTLWLPDLFTAEAEASPKKAQARPALADHALLGPRGSGEQVCCALGASVSLCRTHTFALQECIAHVSFWKRQTCCTSSVGVIREIPG